MEEYNIPSLEGEEWKRHPKYDNHLFSNMGRVWLISKGRFARLSNMRGYRMVSMGDTNHPVHRVIARLFIREPMDKEQVNHKDGRKSNNCVSNLEWCTPQENVRHSIDVLGNIVRAVNQYTKDGKYIRTFPSLQKAAESIGKKESYIFGGLRGKTYSAYSFLWRYAEEYPSNNDLSEEEMRIYSRKNKSASRKVNRYTMDWKYIDTFESVRDAAVACGHKKEEAKHIIHSMQHKRGQISAWGYKWKYVGE